MSTLGHNAISQPSPSPAGLLTSDPVASHIYIDPRTFHILGRTTSSLEIVVDGSRIRVTASPPDVRRWLAPAGWPPTCHRAVPLIRASPLERG